MKRLIVISTLFAISWGVKAQTKFPERLKLFRDSLRTIDSANDVFRINYDKKGTEKALVLSLVMDSTLDETDQYRSAFSAANKALQALLFDQSTFTDIEVRTKTASKRPLSVFYFAVDMEDKYYSLRRYRRD
jgi:hypothetical protein